MIEGEIIAKDALSPKQLSKARSIEQINQYLEAILSGEMLPHPRKKIAEALNVSSGYLESLFGMEVK